MHRKVSLAARNPVLAPGASPAEPRLPARPLRRPIYALPALYFAVAHGLPALANAGYDDASIGIHIPARQPAGGRDLDIDTHARNVLLRSLRCQGERGFALFTEALVLTHFKHRSIK